ncbi:MAG: hypothetical protein ACE15B_23040 [Bryobacteraceae bacterium]
MDSAALRRPLLLLLALVVLVRLPFLRQAIQGDDVYYLAAAQHAQIDPLHPNHVRYVFLGDEVDLRGHPHPPLNAWILAGLLAVAGDVYEVPFHAAYIAFSLIAMAAMWSLARRFSPRPLWAALLFLAVPAFVINGASLEADLPFLAFWMAAIALFTAGRYVLAVPAMALAALAAYQAVFLTPILAVYVWLHARRNRTAWLATLAPLATLAAWQAFERLSTGALPAGVLNDYFRLYGFQALAAKLTNAAALAIHACWMVFPALAPPAVLLAWRKHRDPAFIFLSAWIALFFAGALVVFFAGSARYLLPMAAPVALLASRLSTRWLAMAFAVQMPLSLALAWVNYEHWDGYRRFAASLAPYTANRRVWINGEWGLRYYLETAGGLALRKQQPLRPGDLVVSSALAYPVEFTNPVSRVAEANILSTLPLRLIGLDSRAGYSTASRGLLPFGISRGPIDRVRADLVVDRRPVLEYVPMSAGEQVVAGFHQLEGTWRWMSSRGTVLLRSPANARPVSVSFVIPEASPARRIALVLDGREIASQTFPAPGSYTLSSQPVKPEAASATLAITADRAFSAEGDRRELSIIVTAAGFR